MTRRLPMSLYLLCLGSGLASPALQAAPDSHDLRDPTQIPAVLRAAEPASGAAPGSATQPRQLVVVNGRSYLVAGGRRLGVGDSFGDARIVRFEDGAVVLKEGGVTRRVSLYSGVEKRAVQPPAPVTSTAAPKSARQSSPSKTPLPRGAAAQKSPEQEKP